LSGQFFPSTWQPAAALRSLLFISRPNDFHYPPDLAVFEPYLDAPGMKSGAGKQVLYNAPGAVSAALVFLEDNIHFQARVNITPILSVHPNTYYKFNPIAGRSLCKWDINFLFWLQR
jgi:hypothetical protein